MGEPETFSFHLSAYSGKVSTFLSADFLYSHNEKLGKLTFPCQGHTCVGKGKL